MTRKFSPSTLSLGVAFALFSLNAAHATSGYFASGYGINNEAVAGVGAALPQDALTIAINPAGLTQLGHQLNIGLDVFAPDRSANIIGNAFGPDANYDGNGVKTFYIPNIGYSHPLNDDVTLGIAAYGNGGMNTNYKVNPYGRFGATGTAGVNLEQLFISPAVGWKINDHNSIGIAANIVYQRFNAKGISVFGGFSQDPSHISNNGNDDSYGVGARIGWIGKFNDYLSLGASYQTKTRMSKFDQYAGLFADNGRFDVPENYTLGFAVKPLNNLTIGFDWQRILYSDVAAVGNSFGALLQGKPLGAKDGSGFGWQDVDVYKLGAVWQATPQLTLRGGFSINQQPIPQSETFLNILAPATIEKHLTLGASWAINAKDDISASYTHAFDQKVNGANSIPVGFPHSGFGGGNANIQLQENSYGVAWNHKF
ncbi:MAG: outer membrane protein transport protein [Candidatus Saccharibacteria bacterium]|nr:outer membrane protein transport protein [Moraxellaceae bacterium]